jgi:hypothetical protein
MQVVQLLIIQNTTTIVMCIIEEGAILQPITVPITVTISLTALQISHNERNSPEKQSILDAIEHLLAKYLEIRPLFLTPARPMNVEWKSKPYFGVLLRVLRALMQNKQIY